MEKVDPDQRLLDVVAKFAANPKQQTLVFPVLNSSQRRKVHALAESLSLHHLTTREDGVPRIRVWKGESFLKSSVLPKHRSGLRRQSTTGSLFAKLTTPDTLVPPGPLQLPQDRKEPQTVLSVEPVTPASNPSHPEWLPTNLGLQRSPLADRIRPLPTWDGEHSAIFQLLKQFMDTMPVGCSYSFPPTLSAPHRQKVHAVAEHMGLEHQSFGRREVNERYIRVTILPPSELAQKRERTAKLVRAIQAYQEQMDEPRTPSSSVSDSSSKTGDQNWNDPHGLNTNAAPTPVHTGGASHVHLSTEAGRRAESLALRARRRLRFMNWNVEWMDHYFESDEAFRKTAPEHGVSDVSRMLQRIASIILHIQPDVLAIEEGPANVTRMQLFVDHYLQGAYTCLHTPERAHQTSSEQPPLQPESKAELSDTSKDTLRKQFTELMAKKPRKPPRKKRPTPEQLAELKNHAEAVRSFMAQLNDVERDFIKEVEREGKAESQSEIDRRKTRELKELKRKEQEAEAKTSSSASRRMGPAQEVYFLIRKNGPLKNPRVDQEAHAFLSQEWHVDITGDLTVIPYQFTRIPLVLRGEVEVSAEEHDPADAAELRLPSLESLEALPTPTSAQTMSDRDKWDEDDRNSGSVDLSDLHERVQVFDSAPQQQTVDVPFYAIAVHSKSKYVQGGEELWLSQNETAKQEYIRRAVENRRKISAESIRLRRCIDHVLFARDPKLLLVVSGDFNDGPGMDFFENFFLLPDSVSALLGSAFHRDQLLHAVLHDRHFMPNLEDVWTVEFDDFIDNSHKKMLLDHIFVSPQLATHVKRAMVTHHCYMKACSNDGEGREDRPSDHRPVFADFL